MSSAVSLSYSINTRMFSTRLLTRRTLPSAWTEMTPSDAWTCIDRLMRSVPRRQLVQHLLQVPWYVWYRIDHHQMYDLIACLDWMQLDLQSCEPVAPYIDVKVRRTRERLYLPSAHFSNVVGIEYGLLDDMYQEFRPGQDPEIERQMIAVVLRPAAISDSKRIIGDPRVRLDTKGETETWMRYVEALPESVRAYITMLISANRADIYDTYQDLFRRSDDTTEGGSTGVNFGWWGTFMDVAEDGIFGTYDQVLQTSIHNILIHLYRKWDAYQREKREMEHAKLLNDLRK